MKWRDDNIISRVDEEMPLDWVDLIEELDWNNGIDESEITLSTSAAASELGKEMSVWLHAL